MPPPKGDSPDSSVLKAAREKCHKVRRGCLHTETHTGLASFGKAHQAHPAILIGSAPLSPRSRAAPPPAQARDAFYACVDGAKEEYRHGGPVPSACARQRAAYEADCAPSWVKHFDLVRDKRAEYLRKLQANIRQSVEAGAAGSLAGQAQQGTQESQH